MFVKLTRSGPRRYVQLVESYRDDQGRVKKRTVATLGRLEQIAGDLDSVISGLLKVAGRDPLPEASPPTVSFESARALGDVWALNELWNELDFSRLSQVFRSDRRECDVEALLRVMVFNRLCDPQSKLGVLRWLEEVVVPGVDTATITHQQLLRAMDALMGQREAVESMLTKLLRPLIDQDLAVVFYDLTTISTEGLSTQAGDVRQYGMGKSGLIGRQFMLGVVQTAEGLPIHHQVFEGNTAETGTLLPTLTTILARFPSVRRLILVADRGLLSLDNLEALSRITLPSGQPLEYIIAVPGRRYSEFLELLGPYHKAHCAPATEEVIGELPWQGRRLVVAHDPKAAAERTGRREKTLATLEARAQALVEKLIGQEAGQRSRGRKLSDGGATARFHHEVCEAHLGQIIKVDLAGALFSYHIDEAALTQARLMDGKLLLVTKVAELSATEIVARYKALADIERGFRVLKSQIEIGPVYHRLPDRIRAHAMLCFIALILHRIMRMRLKAADTGLSPDRALERLRRIQYHQVRLNDSQPLSGLSSIDATQSEVFAALQVKKPVASKQLALL